MFIEKLCNCNYGNVIYRNLVDVAAVTKCLVLKCNSIIEFSKLLIGVNETCIILHFIYRVCARRIADDIFVS